MPRISARTVPVLLTAAASLAFLPARASARDILERFDFELSGGYRVDQLDWNIAGGIDGNNPDILSELIWEDLESNQVAVRAKMIMANAQAPFGGVIRLGGSYGEIYSGDNQDSDYGGDGRSREYSRSNNSADSGEVWDSSLGGGLVFFNHSRTLSLTPLLGLSQHIQNLTAQDGYQTVSIPANVPPGDPPPTPVGPFAGLNSTYETKWRSGWLGLDLDYIPTPFFDLHGTVELHSGKYEAEADWNLRSDLTHPRSFRHATNKASGIVSSIGMRAGRNNLFFTLDFNYQAWQAKDGDDVKYYSDGSIGVTKLNEVNWEAASINAGVTVRF